MDLLVVVCKHNSQTWPLLPDLWKPKPENLGLVSPSGEPGGGGSDCCVDKPQPNGPYLLGVSPLKVEFFQRCVQHFCSFLLRACLRSMAPWCFISIHVYTQKNEIKRETKGRGYVLCRHSLNSFIEDYSSHWAFLLAHPVRAWLILHLVMMSFRPCRWTRRCSAQWRTASFRASSGAPGRGLCVMSVSYFPPWNMLV